MTNEEKEILDQISNFRTDIELLSEITDKIKTKALKQSLEILISSMEMDIENLEGELEELEEN